MSIPHVPSSMNTHMRLKNHTKISIKKKNTVTYTNRFYSLLIYYIIYMYFLYSYIRSLSKSRVYECSAIILYYIVRLNSCLCMSLQTDWNIFVFVARWLCSRQVTYIQDFWTFGKPSAASIDELFRLSRIYIIYNILM